MTLNPVFLLPLLALAMVVFLPIFGKSSALSSSIKSRRRRRVLLGRLTVVALLLATLLTLIWPFPGLSGLVQGVLLTMLMVVPGLIAHWIVTYVQSKNKRNSLSEEEQEEAFAAAALTDIHGEAEQGNAAARLNKGQHTDALREVESSWEDSEAPRQRQGVKPGFDPAAQDQNVSLNTFASVKESTGNTVNRRLDVDIDDEDYDYETPAELQDQLDKVSELVQTHDLSDHSSSAQQARKNWREIRENHDKHAAESKDLVSVDATSASDLAKMSTSEITSLVTNLRKDKTRLQKLVIAQQAAIDSERQAHDQSRTVARDAIKIMRDAREAQKFAEKLARRERSERRRIEQQYKKVSNALNNALSIIESRKKESAMDQAGSVNTASIEGADVAAGDQDSSTMVQDAQPVQRDASA